MQQTFGCQPADIIACIGPSIGPCCYEVGSDVIGEVRRAFVYAEDLLISQTDGGIHFDLWAANRRQLQDLGLTQIEEAKYARLTAVTNSSHIEATTIVPGASVCSCRF